MSQQKNQTASFKNTVKSPIKLWRLIFTDATLDISAKITIATLGGPHGSPYPPPTKTKTIEDVLFVDLRQALSNPPPDQEVVRPPYL